MCPTQAWNATVTSTGGQVTAVNVSYNATVATGATVSFGFGGSWSQSNPVPTAFTLNGVACTGSTDPGPGDAMAAVAAMQPGWNLGNTFDAIPDLTLSGKVLRIKGYVTFLSSTTPLDAGRVLVRWIFTAPKANGEGAAEEPATATAMRRG